MRDKLSHLFGIDLRSLAFFRVALAILLLLDLYVRSHDIVAHYSDEGVLPLNAWYEMGYARFSLHALNGSPLFQAFLMALAAVFALFLLVGYQTHLMTFLSWLMLFSIQARNPIVLQGGDILFRILLFWGLFLPLGASFSIDQALNTSTKPRPKRIFSAASFALIMQVCLIYWFATIFKWNSDWLEGKSVEYALRIDQFTKPLGYTLLQYKSILPFLTWLTLAWEGLGPFFVLSPFFTGPIRTLATFGFMFMHLSFGLTMELGLFPYISIAAWIPFLPSWFWDKIFAFLQTEERLHLKIFFQRQPTYVGKLIRIYKTFFLLPQTTLIEKDIKDLDAYWFLETKDGKVYQGKKAFRYLLYLSPLLKPIGIVAKHTFLGRAIDVLYQFLSGRVVLLKRLNTFFPYRSLKLHTSLSTNALVIFLLLFIVGWNIRSLDYNRYEAYFPASLNGFGRYLGIGQVWNMFSRPLRSDGWYVIPGQLVDGRQVDLFREGLPVSWEKPYFVSKTYKSQRWRKYMMNLWNRRLKAHRIYFAKYLCSDWNKKHQGGEGLVSLDIYFMMERTDSDLKELKPKKVLLLHHQCSK